MAKTKVASLTVKNLTIKGAELTASVTSKEMLRAQDTLLKLLESYPLKRRPHIAVFCGAVLLQAVVNNAAVNKKAKGGKRDSVNE